MSQQRKKDYPCLRCKEHVKKNCEAIQCSLCDLWVHKTCEKMSDETFKVLSKASQDAGGMYWGCTACTAYSAKFNKSIQELDRRVSRIEEQIREKEVEIQEVQKEVDSVKGRMDQLSCRVAEERELQTTSVFKEIRERENRRTNLVFHNLKEPKAQSKEDSVWEDNTKVQELCALIGASVKVEEASKFSTRLGKFSPDGCRPLLIGFKDLQARNALLDNSWKLRKEKEGSPWAVVSIVPDLTQLQRKEEESLRMEAKDMNSKLSAEEAKNCCWKVVGRRGLCTL